MPDGIADSDACRKTVESACLPAAGAPELGGPTGPVPPVPGCVLGMAHRLRPAGTHLT